MRKFRPLSLIFVWALASPAGAQTPAGSGLRTWTSNDGKKIDAIFVSKEGENVRLRLVNGQVAMVPLSRLSSGDAGYVAGLAGAPPAATKSPDMAPGAAKEWPRSVDIGATPDPETVKEDPESKEFIYRSGRYEFHCDSKLAASVVREFSRVFESTYLLNCALPLDLKPSPEQQGAEFFIARLYTSRDDYIANGGIEGSAGIYQSGKRALAVPLESLGVKIQGSRVLLEKGSDDDNMTLIHEITHQMMNHWLPKLPTWYIEGSAEAVEMLEYDRGKFNLASRKARLGEYVRRRGNGGKSFTMLDPGELFEIDSRTWAGALSSLRGQATQNYCSAGLMTYYFYYLDGNGDGANIISYLRGLENAGREAEPASFEKHLLRGRSIDDLKDDLIKGFRGEGVDLSFERPGKNSPPPRG